MFNRCKSNVLGFYAARYTLNGTFIDFGPIDISQLQLCNFLTSSLSTVSQVSPFSATNYYQSCSIQVQSLINLGQSPIFYDLYLKYDNTANLLPIPLQVSIGTTQTISGALERRFFLVDAVSGIPASSKTPKYVRYLKSIVLQFELSGGQTNGQIYPPVFLLTYDYTSTDSLQKTVDINFQIKYIMDLTQEQVIIGIIVGVLLLLSFFWAIFRTWIWNKRSGKLSPDLITLFKFFMFLISAIGNVLFLVLIGLALYWLIFYKVRNFEIYIYEIYLHYLII